jgi:hypothetical protein
VGVVGRGSEHPLIRLVPGGGVEPPRICGPADFESAASASSAIPAGVKLLKGLYQFTASAFGRGSGVTES